MPSRELTPQFSLNVHGNASVSVPPHQHGSFCGLVLTPNLSRLSHAHASSYCRKDISKLTKHKVRGNDSASATKLIDPLALPPARIVHMAHIPHVERQQHVLPVQVGAKEVVDVHLDGGRLSLSCNQSVATSTSKKARELVAKVLERRAVSSTCCAAELSWGNEQQ